MATRLLLIRHGQSEANYIEVFTGQGNFALTELGRKQAELTGKFLQNEPIDAFYASDLSRAYETAEAAARFHGMTVVKEPGMREIFAGEWESKRFSDLSSLYPAEYGLWMENIGLARPTGGESVAELQDRVRTTLEKIVAAHPGQTVCIGTHATPIRVMMCCWMHKSLSEMKNIPWVPNASVTSVIYEPDLTFHDLHAGIADHLGELRTALPTNV